MKIARDTLIPLVLFLTVLVTGVLLSPRIGPFWDEPDNIYSAGVYFSFFRQGFDQQLLLSKSKNISIFADRILTQENSIERYPPLPNYLGAGLAVLAEHLGYTLRARELIIVFHWASSLFFALLVVTVYAWSRLIGLSNFLSGFTALTAYLLPTLFGYGYSDLKDIAQVSLFTASLYFLVQGTLKAKTRLLVLGALIWGLALATKFNAVYIPLIWGFWLVLITWQRAAKRNFSGLLRLLGQLLVKISLVVCLGLVAMVVVWPYLWVDTLARLVKVIAYFTTIGRGYHVFFQGQIYTVGLDASLWWYPLINLLFTTPLPLLLLMALGKLTLLGILLRAFFRPKSWSRSQTSFLMLAIWLVVPVSRIFLPGSAFYDGIRHFLEILPPLLIMASLGLATLAGWLSRLLKLGKQALIIQILALALVVYLVGINFSYFPYSVGYLNLLAASPNQNFDRDVEGISVKEAIDWLHANYGAVKVWIPINAHQTWYYLTREDEDMASQTQNSDYIILINKGSHARRWEFEQDPLLQNFTLLHTITRGQAIFGWIYGRRTLPIDQLTN